MKHLHTFERFTNESVDRDKFGDKKSLKESYYDDQKEWEDKAKKKSRKEGVVVHVNFLGNNEWELSDWYDSDYTVASYENGRKL